MPPTSQALFRDSASGMEPFVGVIVGPYDIMLPSSTSASTIFFVQQKTQGLLPFRVRSGLHRGTAERDASAAASAASVS